MDFILFAVATLIIFVAGIGIGLSLSSETRRAYALEYFGLAFLFGAAFVSLASFALGLFLSGFWLRWSVVVACLIAGVAGSLARRRLLKKLRWPKFDLRSDWRLLATLALQIAIVVWACYRLWLGWDALLIWEFKARIAFLSGGAIPLNYFENPTGVWPHTTYPLLLPLTEAWIYNWLGRPDQGLVKLLLPFFYLSAICLLGVGAAQFGGRRWQARLAPILFFFIPSAWIGEGSASSGYADFPLAAFYLAAVIYLVEYWESGDGGSLRLMSALGAVLFWVKEEGVILWACVVLLAGIKTIRRRKPRELLIIVLPGALLFGGWRIFLHYARALLWTDFLPLSFATFRSHLGLIPEICGGVTQEFLRWEKWGILWPGFVCAACLMIKNRSRAATSVLSLAVLLPVICYSGVYIFSAFDSVSVHITSSFSRLLIHVTPAALLFITLAATPQASVQK